MSEVKVKDKDHLVRETYSKAIISTDFDAYERSRKIRHEAQRQRDEIRGATREINNLKCEMHEIKDMLKTLLDRN